MEEEEGVDPAVDPGVDPAPDSRQEGDAEAYLAAKRYAEALAQADRLIRLQPKNLSGLDFKGLALRLSGDYDGALEAYDAILAPDRRGWQPVHQRGAVVGRDPVVAGGAAAVIQPGRQSGDAVSLVGVALLTGNAGVDDVLVTPLDVGAGGPCRLSEGVEPRDEVLLERRQHSDCQQFLNTHILGGSLLRDSRSRSGHQTLVSTRQQHRERRQ